jgi:uncharacterized protein YjbI with pentapeptide repeats
MATEDTSSLSSDQKELDRPPNDQMEKISKQLRKRGYKLIVEYDDTGQPSKCSGEIPPRKTWWDWLDLLAKLAIPLVVVLATIGFGWWQVHLADSQHQQDQQSALDQQQATILQTYIDNIQDLLLNHQLFSKYDFEIRELAQARTVAALSKLDPKRKGIVVQFLRDSGLIGYQSTDNIRYPAIISLARADLTKADLTGTFLEYADLSSDNLTSVNLTNADLSMANLSGATLTNANLFNADLLLTHLSGAIFAKADLSGAYLSSFDLSGSQLSAIVKRAGLSRGNVHLYPDGLKGAYLVGAYLVLATLTNVDLSGANLSGAKLGGATLSGANLSGATLGCYSASGKDYCATLSRATLTNADLSGATLSRATLTNATVSNEQLAQAKSLKGATMPDGSTHP